MANHPPPLNTVLDAVAPRLRAARGRAGLTLAEVFAGTGISVSTLSRLESGQRRPTLELLLPLAALYGVPLDELVGAPTTGDPRVHPRPVRRGGSTIIPLSRTSGILAFKMILPGRTGDAPVTQRAHDGHDWLYVLSGRLRLALGADELVMTAGEAAEFDTTTPHGFASADASPVELLSIVTREGERVHMRSS